MITVDADVILANLLQSRESVTILDLNDVRARIERLVPGVYADVTRNGITWAVCEHPDQTRASPRLGFAGGGPPGFAWEHQTGWGTAFGEARQWLSRRSEKPLPRRPRQVGELSHVQLDQRHNPTSLGVINPALKGEAQPAAPHWRGSRANATRRPTAGASAPAVASGRRDIESPCVSARDGV